MDVHLVDGTYELFRAYYGAPGARAPDGREVGAALGLGRTLGALLRNEGATHVGVAFDHTVESFRNELFDGYKTGEGIDPDLFAQFPLAEEVAAALGLVVWPMVEFEADDALATAAWELARDARVERVRICTPDKDLAQCVEGERVICEDRRRRILLDDEGVRGKFGVPPASIPDWLALVGDAADGIPGVPRWGARSAAIVLAEHGTVEAIPEDPDRWNVDVRGARGLAESLREHRDMVGLYKQLATLRRDVPLGVTVEQLRWTGADAGALANLREALGSDRLGARLEGPGDIPF
ncbi:MAG: 5'-3' exonuclease H3TH domain-containing protein [Acidobacteriota bacterium]|jgi:5'-3' exonuclease